MDGTPLPLSVADISAVLAVYDCPIDRRWFDELIWQLDEWATDDKHKKQ